MASRHSILLVAALLATYLAVTLNWLAGAPAFHGPGFLRLGSPRMHALVVTAAQILPAAALVLVLRHFKRRNRLTMALIVAPFLAMSLPLLLISGIDASDVVRKGHSNALVPLDELEIAGGVARLYQTGGGPTTEDGILLRHERSLIPGFRWTRNVHNWHPAGAAQLRESGDGTILVEGVASPNRFTFGP